LSISNECILKLIAENFADPSGSHLNLHLLSRGQQHLRSIGSQNVVSVSASEKKSKALRSDELLNEHAVAVALRKSAG